MGCEPELTEKKSRATKPRKLNLPKGVPPLTSLYLYIAGSCNLACRHCWIEPDYQESNRNGNFIKVSHLKKAIRQAKPLGLGSVKLTGGEPMLHPRFREIINYIESQKVGMFMETNGILIDDKMARLLKAKKHLISSRFPLTVPRPPLTTGCAELKDPIKSSFRHSLTGESRLQAADNLHPAQGQCRRTGRCGETGPKAGLWLGKVQPCPAHGPRRPFRRKNGFKVRELISLFQKIETEIQPKSKVPVFFDIPVAFFPIKRFLKSNLPCCHVLNILGVLSSGDLSICGVGVTIPELNFGNLAKDDMGKVWARSPKLKELRRFIPGKFEGVCGRCIHRFTCLGACIANNYHLKQKFNAPYYFCDQAFKQGLFPISRLT